MVMLFAGCSSTQTHYAELAAGFENPGKQARPRAYWNWLNGDVTHEGLTRDLEEAKAKGLGGLQMWDTEAMRNPDDFVPAGPAFMGPESVAAMHHSMKEAKRLGLDLGLNRNRNPLLQHCSVDLRCGCVDNAMIYQILNLNCGNPD